MIVGDVGTNSAETLVAKLGVQNTVVFTGSVPHSDIVAYLGVSALEAHWFQENNPQNKTLGIAALEAMGAGKVVFGTADEDVYGKGVLRNGQNVILVNLNDLNDIASKLLEFLGDIKKRDTIGQKARQTISDNFSWDRVCEKTIQAYKSVIDKKISEQISLSVENPPDIP
ncbi:hypothetical protein MASR2M66_18850 [Chloroflexota bacterium]